MPLYHYKCNDCELEVEVIRNFSEYENVPTAEELPKSRKKKVKECKHQNWERLIGQDIRAYRSPLWAAKGRKGHW